VPSRISSRPSVGELSSDLVVGAGIRNAGLKIADEGGRALSREPGDGERRFFVGSNLRIADCRGLSRLKGESSSDSSGTISTELSGRGTDIRITFDRL
jgi:hypothetical protein